MTLEQIRLTLSDRKITAVAKSTGVHPNTIRNIINNAGANPTHRVIKALSDYLSAGVTNG